MTKLLEIRTRVTKPQLEQVRAEALARGYVTIAAYIRDLALNNRRLIEAKIIETSRLVTKNHKILKELKEKA